MKTMFRFLSFAAILAVAAAPAAHATEVSNSPLGGPGVYFGGGNPDCCFAVNTDGTVQLGLKAAVRGVANPIIPSGMDYSVTPGEGVSSKTGLPNGDVLWNFTYSVYTGTSTALSAYTYLITITDDAHPSTTYSYDPTTLGDNAQVGVNACPNNAKGCAYNSSNDGFQNSENVGFFSLPGFNVHSADEYTIVLTATSRAPGGDVVTDTINVVPTPEPSSLVFLGTGLLGGIGTMIRRRRIA